MKKQNIITLTFILMSMFGACKAAASVPFHNNKPSENPAATIQVEEKIVNGNMLLEVLDLNETEKATYIIKDEHQAIIAAGIIHKNKNKILLQNFPEGDYYVTIKTKDASYKNKVLIPSQD